MLAGIWQNTNVVKTTVYLPIRTKKALARRAKATGRSEAELVRCAVQRFLGPEPGPRPKLPLFASGKRDLAKQFDEYLDGVGL